MRALALVLALAACSRSREAPAIGSGSAPAPTPTTPAPSTLSPGIELAEVPLLGYAALAAPEPDLAISPSAITVRGRVVARLTTGAPDVSTLAAALPRDANAPLQLAVDRRVTFAVLAPVLATVARAGTGSIQLLARAGSETVASRLELGIDGAIAPPSVSVRGEVFVVAVAAAPVSVPVGAPNALGDVTAAIVEQLAKSPPPATVTVAVDPHVTMQTLAELLGAIRQTPEGTTLFAQVRLALPPST